MKTVGEDYSSFVITLLTGKPYGELYYTHDRKYSVVSMGDSMFRVFSDSANGIPVKYLDKPFIHSDVISQEIKERGEKLHKDKIRKIIYENSHDSGEGIVIDFDNIDNLIDSIYNL